MRHIGTLPSEKQARRFEDYLLTRDVQSMVELEDDGWAVWIYEEDQVEEAREQLNRFRDDPNRSEYDQAASKADRRRREELREIKEFRKNQVDVRRHWERPTVQRSPAASILLIASVFVAVTTTDFEQGVWQMGNRSDSYVGSLFFAHRADFQATSLEEKREVLWRTLRSGEVYRFVTPIFIHLSLTHLVFNMLWLRMLGGTIENSRGTWRFLALVLFVAVASNLGQFLYKNAAFGGMSGVVYGLFGYLWMKSRYDPQSGFFVPPGLVFLMIGWLIFCYLSTAMPVANAAHTVGLISGGLVGLWPVILRNLSSRS